MMRLYPLRALSPLTDAERGELRERWLDNTLKVGAVLELAGRKVIVRGFDPASVPDRCIYLADAHSGREIAVSAEDIVR
jgi:hypothetical protein